MITEVGNVTIVHGNNLDVMQLMPADSVSACVTDPPYGIGFMGKEWDTFAPEKVKTSAETKQRKDPALLENQNIRGRKRSPAISPSGIEYDRSLAGQRGFQTWTEAWAREVYRILKPGAHLLVCGAPRSYHRMAAGVEDAGFEIRDCLMWVFGQGFPKSKNLDGDWDGWGTALKPAWEPIIVARKPLVGTVAANMEQYQTGAINIDGCRVGDEVRYAAYTSLAPCANNGLGKAGTAEARRGTQGEPQEYVGRWPANLIHDGSDEVVDAFPAAGQLADVSNTAPSAKTSNVYGAMKRDGEPSADSENTGGVGFKMKPGARRLDSGSAARFFYCAKTSKSDRGVGNTHPTVKPTALMEYLVRLVTAPGGVVLDPFFGSGSTGKACAHQGFSCIGIEREAEYVKIAVDRLTKDLEKAA